MVKTRKLTCLHLSIDRLRRDDQELEPGAARRCESLSVVEAFVSADPPSACRSTMQA